MSWLRPETGLAWPGPNYPNGKEPVHTSRLRPETGLAWPGPNYLNGKEPVHMSWNLPGNKLPSWSQPGNKLPSWSQPGNKLPSWSQPGNKLPSWSQPGNKLPSWSQPGNKLPSWSQPGKGEPADADPEWAGGEENPDCIKPCPRIRRYNRRICASNGKTYWNECTFEIAKCEAELNGGTLTVKNEGPCKRPGRYDCAYRGESCREKPCCNYLKIAGGIRCDASKTCKSLYGF